MQYIVFDVETTGLNVTKGDRNQPLSIAQAGDEVIEIGGLILDEVAEPKRMFCHFCDCLKTHSDAAAYNVHGILLEEIRSRLPNEYLEDVLSKWVPEFFEPDIVFVGYNVTFDLKAVRQSLRGVPLDIGQPKQATLKVPPRGKYYVDVMRYLPNKVKLSSFEKQLKEERTDFFRQYGEALRVETNSPELLGIDEESKGWAFAHNALFDSLQTYLLFKNRVFKKKLIPGRG